MKLKLPDPISVVLVLAALWLTFGGWVPNWVTTDGKATAATYVYEKDTTGIPAPVSAALDKLNRRGIIATHDEVDTTDGTDQVPDQYKVSRPAAVAAGLPAFVVMGGEKVLKVVKDPKTEEQIMEAVP